MAETSDTQTLAPEFRVSINGAELPLDAHADVISITVHEDIDAASMFALEMNNWDMVKRKITWADHDLFKEGNIVEIQMGYINQLTKLMEGEITGLEPEFSAKNPPTLIVRGYDRRHRLLRSRITRSFTQLKDSDIASQIAGEMGLTAQTEDTGVTLDYILQHNQTNMEFLQDRAQRIGYEVMIKDNTLFFQSKQHNTGEVLTLDLEGDLYEFYPCLTTMGQAGKVTVRAWDRKDKKEIIGEAGVGDESTTMDGSMSGPQAAEEAFDQADLSIVDRPVLNQAEADRMAFGRFNDIALAFITGEGMCIGRTDLRAGTVIKIEGLGLRFSGLYYVTSVTHSFSPARGYRTAFAVRRNAA